MKIIKVSGLEIHFNRGRPIGVIVLMQHSIEFINIGNQIQHYIKKQEIVVSKEKSKIFLIKQILAVLAAVTEVIKSNQGKESEVEYFAALVN